MSYSKLHSSLVNSSLWTEPDNVRLLFITLLAVCDRHGYVFGSKPGIERLANIDPDDEINPWEVLMSPDPDSSDRMRNPENEGRRIEEVPGGFRLLNFEYYRGLRNDDDRREQNRTAQARFKAKNKRQSAKVSQGKPGSAGISPGKRISEAEAETDTEKEKTPPNGGGQGVKGWDEVRPIKDRISVLFHRRESSQWTPKEITALRAAAPTMEELALIEAYYERERAKGNNGIHRRDLPTFLNHYRGELDRATNSVVSRTESPKGRNVW